MPTHRRASRPALALIALLAAAPIATLRAHDARAQDDQGNDTAPPPPPDDQEEGTPPPEAQAPAQPPDQAQFDQALTPYGHWIDSPEYGRVWVPNSAANADWQPYTDGSWVYTDAGWAFASDVPWGWATFHYGRWGYGADTGWYWVPGYTWAPAWVSWRYTNGHVAWAPYGPRGYSYGSRWHGWVAVPAQHFTHPIAHERIPWAHAAPIIRGAQTAPSIANRPEHGQVYGPPRGVAGPPRGVAGPVRGAPSRGGGAPGHAGPVGGAPHGGAPHGGGNHHP